MPSSSAAWRRETRHWTHPRNSTIINNNYGSTKGRTKGKDGDNRKLLTPATPDSRCAVSSLNQSMRNPMILRRPTPRTESTVTFTSPKVNVKQAVRRPPLLLRFEEEWPTLRRHAPAVQVRERKGEEETMQVLRLLRFPVAFVKEELQQVLQCRTREA